MRKPGARHMIPVLATFAVVASGTVTTQAAASPAAAAPTAGAACTSTKKGVTVVVDFAKLKRHGKIKTACDPSNPKTGLDALKGAGFTYTFVARIPGFVCTIDKEPNPCNGAPVTAYWSYWHAQPHGKWVYSQTGAGTYHPKPGSVQGWAFGAGKPPAISPP